MSAIVCKAGPDFIAIGADALGYDRHNVIQGYCSKVLPVPHWPGAVLFVGSASIWYILAPTIASEFASFDEFVLNANERIPKLVAEWRAIMAGMKNPPPVTSEVVVAGFTKDGPRMFTFRTGDDLPPGTTAADAAESPYYADSACQVIELPNEIATPVPSPAEAAAAHWEGFTDESNSELLGWQIKKHLFIQRHMRKPEGTGAIGGRFDLALVYADRIESRTLCRFPEDRIGQVATVGPIDWDRWHRDNPQPGMSRIKRDIAARKAAKHLRVVR